tara:strand:- start:390 stop:536 length:147 start_codon:yes stop_codon:yes gene_type:complete
MLTNNHHEQKECATLHELLTQFGAVPLTPKELRERQSQPNFNKNNSQT